MSSQKDDFSQNRREPEDSRRTNSEESTKWGNKNIERPTVVTTCAKDTTNEYKEMLGGGVSPLRWPYRNMNRDAKGVDLFSLFFLSPPRTQMWIKFYPKKKKKKKKSGLLQIQTVLVGGSNERRGLADTINIAQVLN